MSHSILDYKLPARVANLILSLQSPVIQFVGIKKLYKYLYSYQYFIYTPHELSKHNM